MLTLKNFVKVIVFEFSMENSKNVTLQLFKGII